MLNWFAKQTLHTFSLNKLRSFEFGLQWNKPDLRPATVTNRKVPFERMSEEDDSFLNILRDLVSWVMHFGCVTVADARWVQCPIATGLIRFLSFDEFTPFDVYSILLRCQQLNDAFREVLNERASCSHHLIVCGFDCQERKQKEKYTFWSVSSDLLVKWDSQRQICLDDGLVMIESADWLQALSRHSRGMPVLHLFKWMPLRLS